MAGMEINATTVLVAAIGSGGLGAVARELFTGLSKLRRGFSLRESGRKDDIVQERDRALARAAMSEAREEAYRDDRDREERNRRRVEKKNAALERVLILNGLDHLVPDDDELEDTITPRGTIAPA